MGLFRQRRLTKRHYRVPRIPGGHGGSGGGAANDAVAPENVAPVTLNTNPNPNPAPDTSYNTMPMAPNASALYIFSSAQISTQPNTDTDYQEIGVIHVTESAAVNVVRGAATDFVGIFGNKGFDNTVFDVARNDGLTKILGMLKLNQKVCNLRMDAESSNPSLFFVHFYGTLLEKP